MKLSKKNIAHGVALLYCLAPSGVLAASEACPPERTFVPASDESPDVTPHVSGMLWKVERRGAPASHLFGTIHLQITRLPPAVALALVKADRLVAETVMDQSAMAYYRRQMLSTGAPNLDSLFEQPFRKRLLDLLADYGVGRQTALQLKPWAAFSLLSRPIPTGAPTLDQMLATMAATAGYTSTRPGDSRGTGGRTGEHPATPSTRDRDGYGVQPVADRKAGAGADGPLL